MQTIDDETTRSVKISGLQKKWNEICRLRHSPPYHKGDIHQTARQAASVEGFHLSADRKESSGEDSSLIESRSAFSSPRMPTSSQMNVPSKQNKFREISSDATNVNCQSKLSVEVSKSWQTEIGSSCFCSYPAPNVNIPSDRASTSSVTSVTTDLGLGTIYASTCKAPKSPQLEDNKERLQHLCGSFSAKFDGVSESTSHQIVQSSSCSASNLGGQHDPGDLKSLISFLREKVGWQDEAICTISQAVCHFKSVGGRQRGSKLKGDIWLTILGPDRVGKKRIALALAEFLYSKESFISINLGSQEKNSIFEHEELDGYDVKFRGKTISDYLAGELSRKPQSVVFLENVDGADFLAQKSLSQAIQTGKFPDSRGREISINNSIFVTTSTVGKGDNLQQPEKDYSMFSENMVLAAKRCQMQISIGCVATDVNHNQRMNVRVAETRPWNPSSVKRRKLLETIDPTNRTSEMAKPAQKASRSFLDLNLPVEEIEENPDSRDCDSDSFSDGSETWFEEFLNQVDEKVVLKPFDFDALAGKLVEEINLRFKRTFGSEVVLEIEYDVMVQILAAAWLSDGKKRVMEDWVEQVLCKGFAEAKQKYPLTSPCVMRLAGFGALAADEPTFGVCLPARIILN